MKIGLVVALAAALIVTFIPNTYTSQAKILPGGQSEGGALAAAAAAFGIQAPSGPTDDSSFEDILNSRWVGERLLRATYSFSQASWRFGKAAPREETLLSYLGSSNMDRGLADLKHVLSAQRDLKSGLLTVEAQTRSPELSHQITVKAVDLLQQFILTQSQTKGGQKAAFISQRLEAAKQEYKKAEDALAAFMAVNQNFAGSLDPRVKLKGISLQAQLDFQRQVVSTLMTSQEQALIDKANDTPVLNILDPGDLPVEKSGPHRGLWVIAGFLLAFMTALGLENKAWIMSHLVD